jgi:hypothetical protein
MRAPITSIYDGLQVLISSKAILEISSNIVTNFPDIYVQLSKSQCPGEESSLMASKEHPVISGLL